MGRLFRLARALAYWAEDQFDWLFRNVGFPAQVLLVLLASWGLLGAELGVERLFWSESLPVQLGTGLAVGMLCGVVLLVWYLLDRPHRAVALAARPGRPTLFPSANEEVRRFGAYLIWAMPVLLAVMLLGKALVVALALRRPAPPFELGEYLAGRYYLVPGVAGYLLSMVLGWLLFVLDERLGIRDRIGRWSFFRNHAGFRSGRVPAEEVPLHAVSAYLVIVGLLFLAGATTVLVLLNASAPGRVAMSPVVLVCLVFIVVTQVYGYWSYHVQLGTLALLAVAFALAAWNSPSVFPEADYKVRFPGLDQYYAPDQRVRLSAIDAESGWPGNEVRALPGTDAAGNPRQLLRDADILAAMSERWQSVPPRLEDLVFDDSAVTLRRSKTRPKIVLVAVSGGGIRSAVWTGVVLEGLEKTMPGGEGKAAFRDHVRLFTGASGGMVGASLWVADFERNYPDRGEPAVGAEDQALGLGPVSSTLAEQSLLPTVQTAVMRDFSRNVLVPPWKAVAYDRGRSLEDKWMFNARARGYGPPGKTIDEIDALRASGRRPSPFNRTFADLHALEAEGRRPSLVFSPMLVEDSRRLLVSNLDLRNLAVAVGPLGGERPDGDLRGQYSRSGLEFFKLFPEAHSTFQVGTAARMSATFPVVSPAVSLPTVPARRVVDAGYFDNYGVDLASMWMIQNRMELLKHCGGVAIVEIRAFPLQERGREFHPGGDPEQAEAAGLLADAVSTVSTPLRAVLRARANASYHRNNELLATLDHAFNTAVEANDPFFRRFVFELNTDASLNWYLSSEEKKGIAGRYRNDPGVQSQAKALAEWFGDGGGPAR
jgi:hypothetical protein